ncbi:zinc finger protein 596-like [Boleophthalmus pectinirostris]|uniref:zinc finger protein 596-like n=1 Tax=Boleophthalmus pectinirostris TaxID=150288 RepID=UPI002431C2BA|nr:zinc finger protein 596-like [Boleophthalmus pectinirostris]
MEQHRRLHSEEKGHGCEFCGKHFQDSMRLRMHMLSHTGTKSHSSHNPLLIKSLNSASFQMHLFHTTRPSPADTLPVSAAPNPWIMLSVHA